MFPFNQSQDIIHKLDFVKYETLFQLNCKYGGLCEIICNRLLVDDFIGKAKDKNSLREHITVEKLDEKKIKESHLLKVYSVFWRAIAYLFNIYPNNIFSCFDQWNLVNKSGVNEKILKKGLEKIENGETLKLEVFKKIFLSFEGHSLLVKKISNDNYIFFDPNTGEHRDLSFSELTSKINAQLDMWHGSDIFLTKGSDYLKRIAK